MKRPRTPGLCLGAILAFLLAACHGDDGSGRSWFQSAEEREAAKRDSAEVEAPRILSQTHLAAGKMLERQNNLLAAAEQYTLALAEDPALEDAYSRLGVIHMKLEAYEIAEAILLRGLRAIPDSATIRNNLGYCYMHQGRNAEAEEAFRGVLALYPHYSRSRMNLAVVLAKMRRLGESAIEFSRVLPADAAFFNVAVVCLEMRDHELAAAALEKALTVNPDYALAREELSKHSGDKGGLSSTAPAGRDEATESASDGAAIGGAGGRMSEIIASGAPE